MKKRYNGLILLVLAIILLVNAYSLENVRSTMVIEKQDAGTQIFFIATEGISSQELWFSNSKFIEQASVIIESSKEIQGLPNIQNTYEYETIAKLGISEDELSDFKVKFRVKQEWIKNNSQKETINLYYYDTNWVKSETKYVFSDGLYDYFESYPKKINYLAISGDLKKQEIITPIVTTPEESNIIKDTTNKAVDVVTTQATNVKNYLSTKNIIIYSIILTTLLITLIIIYSFFNLIYKGEYLDNVKEAEDFIDEELAEGISKKQIEKDLEEKGWPKKVVEKLVYNHHLSPDTEIKIRSSIQNMRNNMLSDAEIKKALEKEGWATDLIDEIYEEFTS